MHGADTTVKNKTLLKQYTYIYGWNIDDKSEAPPRNNMEFRQYEDTQEISLFSDILDGELLKKIEKNKRLFDNLPNKKVPIYLYFSSQAAFRLFLYRNNVTPLLERERVVFLIGEGILKSYFKDMQTLIPKEVFGFGYREVQKEMKEIAETRQQNLNSILKEVKEFYEINGAKIRDRIVSGKPRILLIKHRFSYAIKNHTRDCNHALRRLGYETFVSEEKSDISRIYRIADINKYKPDLIMDIDEFRYTYTYKAPRDIIYVTWIQDYLPHVLDPNMVKKLGKTDYVMNHYVNDKRIFDLGYPQDRIVEVPVCANAQLYKPYPLTEQEKKTYQSDLCIVGQGADLSRYIKENAAILPADALNAVMDFASAYYEDFKQNQTVCRKKQDFFNQMSDYLYQSQMLQTPKKILEQFTDNIFIGFHERLYRQVLADWIIEAGYTNLKLWGAEWVYQEKYKPYAMGQAENGEVLSKILQSSKIVLGNNFFSTGVARAWESMLSGAFYMSNNVPENEDLVNIRTIMTENENLVIFYDKKDLLHKINFYLHNEKERKKMIENGRKRALETMTFDAAMIKTMNFIKKSQEDC